MGRLCDRLSERLVRAGAWETAAGAHETAAGASEVQPQCNATVRQCESKQHLTSNMQRVNEDMGRLGKRTSERLVRAGACGTAAGASEVHRQCNASVLSTQSAQQHWPVALARVC